MDIKSKATEYVDDALLDSLREIVEKAYADGYAEGCEDSKSSVDVELDDDDWVDLGLPSGTLWAADYVKDDEGDIIYLPYDQAVQYELPTEEQLEELHQECEISFSGGREVSVLGPNGKTLNISTRGYYGVKDHEDYGNAYFWVQSDRQGNNQSCARSVANRYSSLLSTTLFKGYWLPIRVVRKK